MDKRGLRKPLAAPETEGLNALDRDRAASLADEGGASASALEAQDLELPIDARRAGDGFGRPREGWRRSMAWPAAALFAAGAVVAWNVFRRRGRA
jgi:hypothetical protein